MIRNGYDNRDIGGMGMKIRFKAEFARDWVMTREATVGKNPISHLRECIQKIIGPRGKIKLLDSGYTDCNLVFCTEELTFEKFEIELWRTLEDEFQIGKGSKEAVIQYNKVLEEEEAEEMKKAQTVSAIRHRMEGLLGAISYKQLLLDVNMISSQVTKLGIQRVFNAKAYLFSVDDGCGLTTYLDIFANLVDSLHLFTFSGENHVIETVVEKNDKDPWLQYNAIGKFKHKMICFDISQWVHSLEDQGFKRFLRKLRSLQKDYIYVFRIPYLEEPVLGQVYQAISDAMYTEKVVFPPFTYKEYFEYIAKPLAKYGFSISLEAKEEFNKKVLEEKSKGSFYGLRTMHKIAYEMMHRKMLVNAQNNTFDTVIRPSDLAGWAE